MARLVHAADPARVELAEVDRLGLEQLLEDDAVLDVLAGRDPDGRDVAGSGHGPGRRRGSSAPRSTTVRARRACASIRSPRRRPHLVRVHHQDAVRPELSPDQSGAAVVRGEVATHLHLHVGEARHCGFADERLDLGVVVAEPAGGRRIGGVARGDDRLLASCALATRRGADRALLRAPARR